MSGIISEGITIINYDGIDEIPVTSGGGASATITPPPGALLLPVGALLPPFGALLLSSDEELLSSDEALLPPRVVPPAPFTLSHHLLSIKGESSEGDALRELRARVESALGHAAIDFEFPGNWKYKCYASRSSGQCHFKTTIYRRDAESIIIELQRRNGCHVTFISTYHHLMDFFGARGLLVEGSAPAVRYASILAKRALAVTTLAESIEDAVPPPSPDSLHDYTVTDDSSNLEPQYVRIAAVTLSLSEAHEVLVDMKLGHLMEELISDFDDVSTPAAQQLALLVCNNRVRAAFGAALAQYFSEHTGVGKVIIELLSLLIRRATDDPAGKTSLEGRTACALALASMARQREVANALFMFKAPTLLINATEVLMHPGAANARNAALRRQLMRALWHIISTTPKHTELSRPYIASHAFISAPASGADRAFDEIVRMIKELLDAPMIKELCAAP